MFLLGDSNFWNRAFCELVVDFQRNYTGDCNVLPWIEVGRSNGAFQRFSVKIYVKSFFRA